MSCEVALFELFEFVLFLSDAVDDSCLFNFWLFSLVFSSESSCWASDIFCWASAATFRSWPDGNKYVTDGHVNIDIGKESTPEKTIEKMRTVISAAHAPAEPSGQDLNFYLILLKQKCSHHCYPPAYRHLQEDLFHLELLLLRIQYLTEIDFDFDKIAQMN